MSDKLEVMVIPYQDNASAIVPRKLVEYVLPYAMPLPSSYTHKSLVGSIIYQNEKIPIVDLSKIGKQTENAMTNDDGKRRIITLSCLKEHGEFTSYAVVANSAPRLLEITEDDINETTDELDSPFHSRIELDKLGQDSLMVLDLEALEEQIFD